MIQFLSPVMSVFRARWFLPVLLGGIALVSTVSFVSYNKGYSKAELAAQEELNKALAAQLETISKIHQEDLKIVATQSEKERSLEHAIEIIPRTDADCHSPDWLRVFNAGIRAVNTYSAPAP